MKKKLLVLLTILLYLLIVISSNVYADDDFIYGVQIFNRPIDWKNDNEGFRKLLVYADDLGVNLIRGGTTADNVSDHINSHNGVLVGMNSLLPMLEEYDMTLNWVLVGTAKGDCDNSAIVKTGEDWQIPPLTENWKNIIKLSAQTVRTHNVNVIYEIWNEPDHTFWRGTISRYWDSLFADAVNEIHNNDSTNASIINGGLVLGQGESEYMTRAINALKAGNISMLAIHAHNPFYTFMRLIENENFSGKGVSMSQIFLNECGYDGKSGSSEGGKTFNIAAKILGAKALGMKGIVTYHMGLKDSLIVEGNDHIIRYSQLINVSENGSLTPTESYYAVKAAIRFTKGLTPDSGNDISASDNGYVWLFTDGKKRTLACIGRSPGENELAGLESDSYEIYDIYGNEISAGSVNQFDIVYYVTGFNDEPVPPTPAITITTGQSDFDAEECTVNNEYSFELKSNPSGALWSVESGNLPDGLYIQGSKITGIPSRAGKYDFTLLAELDGYESSRADFSITVAAQEIMQTISIKTDKLKDATEGENYNATLESDPSGASWSCSNLPDGLTISSSSNSSGKITGKPSVRGKYTLQITASKEGWLSSTVNLDLTVKEPSPEPANPESDDTKPSIPIEIITEIIDGGKFGEDYNFALKSNTEGVKWILEDENSLPEGLSLNENTGLISGIPKKTGKFEFTVYAEKDDLISDSKTFTIIINYAGKIEILTTQKNFDAYEWGVGGTYSVMLESNPSSVKWSKSEGELPQGLTLYRSGSITGTPTRAGTYEFTLLAELDGYESASRKFSLNVKEAETPPVTPHHKSSSGGGGCNSGFYVVCASAAILLLKRR